MYMNEHTPETALLASRLSSSLEVMESAADRSETDDFLLDPEQLQVKVKVRTLDTAPLRESSPQKRSGMARVLKGFHSFTCTPTRSCFSAIGMSHTCLCIPSYSWYSFTDP